MNEIQLQNFLQGKQLGKDFVFGQPIFLIPLLADQNPPVSDNQPQQPHKEQEIPEELPYVVHRVNPNEDTLMGLSIQYKISARAIKNFNDMDSDEIYYMKTIKIPHITEEQAKNMTQNLPKDDAYYEQLQKIEQKQKLTFMREYVMKKEDKCDQIALYYLQEAEWDENKAIQMYKDDIQWEDDYVKQSGEKQWIKI